ncbi:hypothetical protein F4804DRAFT_304468 [Jackrogersella minutella]|nr:hypothetical protein F4804DRAFT_304468 [Jackrogersella minutella]
MRRIAAAEHDNEQDLLGSLRGEADNSPASGHIDNHELDIHTQIHQGEMPPLTSLVLDQSLGFYHELYDGERNPPPPSPSVARSAEQLRPQLIRLLRQHDPQTTIEELLQYARDARAEEPLEREEPPRLSDSTASVTRATNNPSLPGHITPRPVANPTASLAEFSWSTLEPISHTPPVPGLTSPHLSRQPGSLPRFPGYTHVYRGDRARRNQARQADNARQAQEHGVDIAIARRRNRAFLRLRNQYEAGRVQDQADEAQRREHAQRVDGAFNDLRDQYESGRIADQLDHEVFTHIRNQYRDYHRGQYADGLGDRDRSLSPEGDGVWDTLQSTLTPDPQPPSVGSSFASTTVSTATSQNPTMPSSRTSTTSPGDDVEPPCDPANGPEGFTDGNSDRGNSRNRRSYAEVAEAGVEASVEEPFFSSFPG